MLIVMQHKAPQAEIDSVCEAIRKLELTPHPMPGPTRTAIGVTGNTGAIDARRLEVLPGVRELIRVTKPYKLASREMHPDDTIVQTPQTVIGPGTFTIIAGPCSCEDESLMMQIGEKLQARGIRLLRAGAFKPRTSPYSYQGPEHEGLKLLAKVAKQFELGIVTELMDTEYADDVAEASAIIQIGTRNMQNFSLLKRAGQLRKPILLKRGLSATLGEWLMAAEYLMAGGNTDVILCERGVRTFSDHTRNTLDLSIIPPIQETSHLPILVDPSHGTGKRNYVEPMALAALAAGADGIMVEVHPSPDEALSDAAQTISFEQLDAMLEKMKPIADAMGKTIC